CLYSHVSYSMQGDSFLLWLILLARTQKNMLHFLTSRHSTKGTHVSKIWSFEVWRMGKNALISAMLKFHFGNAVFCSDGQGGTLVSVLFDASTKRMTQIAVKRGRLFGKTVYLPFASVTT